MFIQHNKSALGYIKNNLLEVILILCITVSAAFLKLFFSVEKYPFSLYLSIHFVLSFIQVVVNLELINGIYARMFEGKNIGMFSFIRNNCKLSLLYGLTWAFVMVSGLVIKQFQNAALISGIFNLGSLAIFLFAPYFLVISRESVFEAIKKGFDYFKDHIGLAFLKLGITAAFLIVLMVPFALLRIKVVSNISTITTIFAVILMYIEVLYGIYVFSVLFKPVNTGDENMQDSPE